VEELEAQGMERKRDGEERGGGKIEREKEVSTDKDDA
jgi:hypothetical protein